MKTFDYALCVCLLISKQLLMKEEFYELTNACISIYLDVLVRLLGDNLERILYSKYIAGLYSYCANRAETTSQTKGKNDKLVWNIRVGDQKGLEESP